MKDCFDKVIKDFTERRTLDGLADAILKCSLGKVCDKTVYNRFKSYYGCSPRDKILENIYPSHQEIVEMIIDCENVEEFKRTIDLPHTLYKGLYDREFGVSTFQKSKVSALEKGYKVSYNPVREDNRSIWYSQLLGDGSYCAKRHAFRIIHGAKQGNYLKWKVALLNKAYPKTPSKVTHLTHKQGHTYYSYYSGNIGNIDIPHTDRSLVIPKLTPLGWLLWWLDDGGKYQNITIFSTDVRLCEAAIKELATYGIKARHSQNGIQMCGESQDIIFYKNFIDPFISDIPKCMLYKVEDIVGNV